MREEKGARILMIGTEPGLSGGIAAVVQGYVDCGFFDRFGIDYLATHRVGTPLVKVSTYLGALARLVFSLRSYRIVHIHTASWWSFRRLYPAILLAKVFGKKLILHLHGGQFDSYYDRASLWEKGMIRHGFSLSDRTVVLSEDWFDRMAPFCRREAMTVIPNGVRVDGGAAPPRADGAKLRVLFLGDIIRRKGVYDLIDALSFAAPALPPVEVNVCGRGEVEKARRYAAEKGVHHLVTFPGWVGGAEKERLLQGAHLFVLPSHSECFPVSLLEAMAHGVPVVVTAVGGVPGVVESGVEGLLVPVGDVEALARALVSVLGDETKRRRMGEGARMKVATRFSMERIGDSLWHLYTEVGGESPLPNHGDAPLRGRTPFREGT